MPNNEDWSSRQDKAGKRSAGGEVRGVCVASLLINDAQALVLVIPLLAVRARGFYCLFLLCLLPSDGWLGGVIPVSPHQQQYFAAERWRRLLGVPPFSVGSWDEGHGHLHTTPLLKEGAWRALALSCLAINVPAGFPQGSRCHLYIQKMK